MREPCRTCGSHDGYIEIRNGQNCVHCRDCESWVYNAPRTETGQEQRSVTTVHNGIKPAQRCRIITRALGRCEICGATDKPLHAGHIVSVEDGLEYGLTNREINSDDNLAALCEECNLGMGRHSFSPTLYIVLLRRRLA